MSAHEAGARAKRHDGFAVDSLGLYAGKGLQMACGFVFWVLAAQVSSVTAVGIVASAVAGVMLCTQLGVLGAGSAVIMSVGRGARVPRVLDTAFSIVILAGGVTALAYLGLVRLFQAEAAYVLDSPYVATAFLVATIAGTALICLDQVGAAVRRGYGAIGRYAAGGLATVATLGLIGLSAGDAGADVVFAAWSLGAVAVCAWGAVQLRRWLGYSFRPHASFAEWRRLLGVGFPNQLLTLTERVPALLVPVLVAYTVSADATAYWYPAWMMAWIAYTAPVQVGIVQFAEGVRHPDRMRRTIGVGLRWALLSGGTVALVLVAAAEPMLSLMGDEYADASATALRLLAVGVIPYVFWQAYNAACRARGLLAEAIIAGVVLAVAICLSTVWAAPHGPTAMAVAWIVSSTVGSSWATIRLIQIGAAGHD